MKERVCVFRNQGPGAYSRQKGRFSVGAPCRIGEKIKQHEFDPGANSLTDLPHSPASVICLRYVSAEPVNGNGALPWKRSPAAPLFSSRLRGHTWSSPPPLPHTSKRVCWAGAPAIIIFVRSGVDALPVIYDGPTTPLGLIVWE